MLNAFYKIVISYKGALAFSLLLSMIWLCSQPLYAQRTQYYLDSERAYKEGVDLFQKQKYGAAQLRFDEFLRASDKKTDYAQSAATYYYAACAIELFHENAEYLMKHFIDNYPHSNKVIQAYFQLAKLQFRKKDYNMSIAYFLKTDVNQLSKNEAFEYYYKLGYSRFQIEDYDKALLNFEAIKDQKNIYQAAATYYFAHISYLKKNYEVALQHFLSIQKEKAFSRLIPFYVAQIYYLQGKYQEAVDYAEPIVDTLKGKNVPLVRRLLAESYFELKNDAKAISNYEAYLATGSSLDRDGYYQMGVSCYRIQRFEDALTALKNCTAEDDLMTQTAYYYMADCYIKTNQKRVALEMLKQAASMKYDKRIAQEALFNFAKLSYELGYNPYNDAIDAINLYISTYPQALNIEEAYEIMVNIYLNTQNYKDALQSLSKITNKNTKLKIAEQRIYYFRAIELFNNLEYESAIQHLQEAIKLNYDNRITAESKFWLAEAKYRMLHYAEAGVAFDDFLTSAAAKSVPYYYDAYYGLGYSYLKRKKYADAATEFRNYTASPAKDTRKIHDAYLRIGDCYFMMRDYNRSITYYDQALQTGQYVNDYALYQKALIQGLNGDQSGKAKSLKQALEAYPNSAFKEEMQYELGLANIRLGKTNEAVTNFESIVNSDKTTAYLSKAYLQLGLIYFNADNNREALGWYKRVVDEYPNSSQAAEALKYIRNIYIELGDIDAYTQYIKGIQHVELSAGSLDSASYAAAETALNQNNCARAIESFDKYIRNFPKGIFLLEAHHYKAECHVKQEEPLKALEDYQYVFRQRKNMYSENALNRAASILEKTQDSLGLIEVYKVMEEQSETPDLMKKARIGLMINYFKTQRCDLAINYAKTILTFEKLNEYTEEQAHYIQASCYYKSEQWEEALSEYKKVATRIPSEFDIEANYRIGEIFYKQNKYTDAEKHLRSAIKNMGSDKHMLALSFILLSDIYVEMNDNPQAKSMLNTVIAKHDEQDLIDLAQSKLETILERERQDTQPRLKQDNEFELDDNQKPQSRP